MAAGEGREGLGGGRRGQRAVPESVSIPLMRAELKNF